MLALPEATTTSPYATISPLIPSTLPHHPLSTPRQVTLASASTSRDPTPEELISQLLDRIESQMESRIKRMVKEEVSSFLTDEMENLILQSLSVQTAIRSQVAESQKVLVDKLDEINTNIMRMQANHDNHLQTVINILNFDASTQKILD